MATKKAPAKKTPAKKAAVTKKATTKQATRAVASTPDPDDGRGGMPIVREAPLR
jgi:hypothetical protein